MSAGHLQRHQQARRELEQRRPPVAGDQMLERDFLSHVLKLRFDPQAATVQLQQWQRGKRVGVHQVCAATCL
jgi:hypothetical protein